MIKSLVQIMDLTDIHIIQIEKTNLVLKELLKSKVFTYSKGRKHKHFHEFDVTLLIEQN